ncbi:MAG: ABC transporter permease [Lautropia sp.]|nr:ABC transporter permease [Lautropia sp.]
MKQWLKNIWQLGLKELQSLSGDFPMVMLIIAVFSVIVYSVAVGAGNEVKNAAVGVIDDDRSALSLRIRDALLLPQFKPAEDVARAELDTRMDQGDYVFVLVFPPDFEADVLAGRQPVVQLLADATALSMAGVGTVHISDIVGREVAATLGLPPPDSQLMFRPVVNVWFNPNGESTWFKATMQVMGSATLLAMLVAGAAVIREREHGTIEHLLVMPVRPSEIMLAKILANCMVITGAAWLSLRLLVVGFLGVRFDGSVPLFMLGMAFYMFSLTSLGVWLATLTPNMPQFGLVSLLIYIVTRLTSGTESPLESMPDWLQALSSLSPVTQFVSYGQSVLLRGAEIGDVWGQLAALVASGVIFLGMASMRFRAMLAQQG